MNEFRAVARFVLEKLNGLSDVEKVEVLAWALAAERYRTINDLQQDLGNLRLEMDRLMPAEFHQGRDRNFVLTIINTALYAQSRENNAITPPNHRRETR